MSFGCCVSLRSVAVSFGRPVAFYVVQSRFCSVVACHFVQLSWALVVPCVVAAISIRHLFCSFREVRGRFSTICFGVCRALHGCCHPDSFVVFFSHFLKYADVFQRDVYMLGCLSCLADIFHRSHLHTWAFVVPCVVAAISSFSSKSSICLGVVWCALHGCRHLDSFVNFFAHFVECADVPAKSSICLAVCRALQGRFSYNMFSLSLSLSLCLPYRFVFFCSRHK